MTINLTLLIMIYKINCYLHEGTGTHI